MPQIRPVSDLRNNFTEISKIVHGNQEEVYLTKNGHSDMVVMSMEQFDRLTAHYRIDLALRESDAEVRRNPNCGVPFQSFAAELRKKLMDEVGESHA